jgi:predicted MPP superfamily phosphohydrolase
MSRKSAIYFSVGIVVLLLGFFIKAYTDTNTIEVTQYTIENSPLGAVLGGVKVVQLSDLHLKKVGLREKKVLEILKAEQPDLILLTGDYIHFKGPYEPVMAFFSQLRAPLGVYGVLGNTDYYNENGSCILCHQEKSKTLKKGSPYFLRNSAFQLRIKGKTLFLIGVDDPVNKKADVRAALKGVEGRDPAIFLAHSPELFEEAVENGLDLVLSGHTHGGQIAGIGLLQKILPLDPSLELLKGFFQKGRTLMFVNRGLGTSYLPFRFGVKPEITFFKFGNSSASSDSPGPAGPDGTLRISNNSSRTYFSGLSLADLGETLKVFTPLRKLFDIKDSSASKTRLDFETEEDLQDLNWECHKWFERSADHATSGRYSLKVTLPSGRYPGISFKNFRGNWAGFKRLEMDVFNPSPETIPFHLRIDDHKSGWEYAARFDQNIYLDPGPNPITIPLHTLKTNLHSKPLNLEKIERLLVFIPGNRTTRELFIDNIRLERSGREAKDDLSQSPQRSQR